VPDRLAACEGIAFAGEVLVASMRGEVGMRAEASRDNATTPAGLAAALQRIVSSDLRLSVMIWGPPGVGKSSVVAQVAQASALELVDLRLGQLAPTDLRGLPVARDGLAQWYPPEFLPRDGKGVLFLDELNMAPPALQGIAQQLILDRRVGSYRVPDGWFIWAAGNRKEDRASVFDMPAPLANRFVHFTVAPDLDAFKAHAIAAGIDERLVAFLSFRPSLLHRPDATRPAWPSPRSWMMADRLLHAGLGIEPAVGDPVAAEFAAFTAVYSSLPDLDAICAGRGPTQFPAEPSARYAIAIGLSILAKTPAALRNALGWLVAHSSDEWTSLVLVDAVRLARSEGRIGPVAKALQADPVLREKMAKLRDLILQ
jgi:MoxR-like ATPase